MENQNWAWVCTCGAIIPREPEGRHQDDGVNAHAAQHREEAANTANGGFGPAPATIVSRSEFPRPYAYQMTLTNRETGAVAPRPRYVVLNPVREAFNRHGGTPYLIQPQHDEAFVSPLGRIDRAIRDVAGAVALIEQCGPPLADGTDAEVLRRRLAQAVNGLCSAARDIQILKDELFIRYAARDAEALRQRRYLPFEAEPMFGLGSDEERYFNDRGLRMQGPETIHEALGAYWLTLRRAAGAAARALLADEADMRSPSDTDNRSRYRQDLFEATRFAWQDNGGTLHWVRSLIVADDESSTT